MDITSAECRELLNHLRFQVRGTGWVGVDEILSEEFIEEAETNPFRQLQAYLHGVQEKITARCAGGLDKAIASLNQTLGKDGEGIHGIMLETGEGEARPLNEFLPADKNVREFAYVLRELETFIANANYVERPDEPLEEHGGPSVTI